MPTRRRVLTALSVATVSVLPTGKVAAQTTPRQQSDQGFVQQAKLTPDDGDPDDQFGFAVAVEDNTVLIGAPVDEDPNGAAAGSAYVFEQSNGQWSQQAKLTPDDGDSQDRFGFGVALDSGTAIVGAPADEDPNGTGAGSAYVFEQSNEQWSQQAKLTPDDGEPRDQFGIQVALDADTTVIGAYQDENQNGEQAGSAYVFTRADSGWSQQTKLTPDDGDPEDNFGLGVALEGDTVAIGAARDETPNGANTGSAYIFTRTADAWSQQAKLAPDDGDTEDLFGARLGLNNGTAVISARRDSDPNGQRAGSAYVFERSDDQWSQRAKLVAEDGDSDDRFGFGVAVDGDTALIGAIADEDPNGPLSGSAYSFSRNNGQWSQQAKLTPDDGDSEDSFGSRLALDGDTAVISSYWDEDPNGSRAGSAYVYQRTETGEQGPVAEYDTNGRAGIQPAEAQNAIVDLNNGKLTPREVQDIIAALNS